MASLYANENFPLGVVRALRTLGHDVLTSHEAGNANQSVPDSEVLAFAVQTRRTLLTINRRDFIRLHHDNPDHAGIVVCSQDPDLAGQADRIHRAIMPYETLVGRLIRVTRPR